MKRLSAMCIALIALLLSCSPAGSPAPTATPQPSPTPGHTQAMPWLLPEGQYLFVEVTMQVDSTVVEGKPQVTSSTDMPTYEFDPGSGVLRSRAGFMPPHDAKVIVGVKRTLHGAAGSGTSSVLNAYTALPAGDGAPLRVVAVDSDGSARMEVGADSFILPPQQAREFSHDENQSVTGGKLKLTTQTRIVNFGVQSLDKINAAP